MRAYLLLLSLSLLCQCGAPQPPVCRFLPIGSRAPAEQVLATAQANWKTLGIPAVAWTATSPVGVPRPKFQPPNGQPGNVTVLLDFSTPVPQWNFQKRWIKQNYRVEANDHCLAADWTAPIDFFWYMCDLDDLRIQNVRIPERFTEETGLFFLQPYDPEKIPVVMVHGLASSPDAYRDILNDLSPEPWFHEHYQGWLYNYPTGTTWLYCAMLFRQNMEEAADFVRSKGPDTNFEKMVILSHSMGGLLARTAITDPEQALYNAHFKTPFDQLGVKPKTRDLIREGLLYEPLTTPKRVVFMAVPHKGSPIATFRGTSLISKLIKRPKSLTVGLLDATVHSMQDNIKADIMLSEVRPPTSISSLSPNSLGFEGLSNTPLPENISFHSIIGGKGDGDTPESSDGVVPYWSSHIEPVESELIVPSNHSVSNDPAAADEVRRILFLHLKEENMLYYSTWKQNSVARSLRQKSRQLPSTMITNVLGTELKSCCTDPITGFYRDGYCRTGPGDIGLHTVCAQVTTEFLEFSKNRGNDLSTPRPEFDFPGLKDGDIWCLCVQRWVEALEAGKAPKVNLEASHLSVLEFADLDSLKAHST